MRKFFPAKLAQLASSLRPMLSFLLSALSILLLSRLLLVAWQWQRVSDAQMLENVLVQGLRFDLVTCGLLFIIPALSFPLSGMGKFGWNAWKGMMAWYLPACFTMLVFMEISTPSFVTQYDVRPNALFFKYLIYPKEVLSMLWKAYPLQLIIGFAAVPASVIWMRARLRRPLLLARSPGFATAVLATPLLLVLCVAMVRSTTAHRPVSPSTVARSNDPMVNELSLNSSYSLLYAAYERLRESENSFPYTRVAAASNIAAMRAEMLLPAADFTHADIPTLHRQLATTHPNEPLNLVIILEESLGAEFVGSLGGLPLTPNLDSLAAQGLWFERLYATGTRSIRGIEAVVTGFTPSANESVVKLSKSQRGFFTLGSLLKEHGYATSFIYGGEGDFDNMRRFFVGNGFDQVIDQKDYIAPVFLGSWGVSDEDLFQRAHEQFEAAQGPFFSLVFTATNHSPYEYPDGRIELYEPEPNTVNNAVKYADYALGEFFKKARQSKYWEHTVFMVVADHNSRVYGASLVPIERFRIPGLILGGSIVPGRHTGIASQIDLGPTLLSLIGMSAEHPMVGRDLTRPDLAAEPGRAMMQYYASQAYLEDEQVVVLQRNLAPRQFIYKDGAYGSESEPSAMMLGKALDYANWSDLAYENQWYRLPEIAAPENLGD
ncbi:MAG: LTA synthase family protein [Gammaproteobacteria bacterium]|nr:LTA synthase family protein [Gammaproteobacteria bacterium]